MEAAELLVAFGALAAAGWAACRNGMLGNPG